MDKNILIQNLQKHCEFLADPKLNGRVPGKEGNLLAREYIKKEFEDIGLVPLFDNSWYQEYMTKTVNKRIKGANVGGMLRGAGNSENAPSIILGAHYDHLEGIPGADDNASSIAIMIEVTRIWAQREIKNRRKNLIFVAFDTEERPYYLTPDMGSIYFHNNRPVEQIDCAIILDLCGHDFPLPGKEDAIFIMGVDSSPTLAEELPLNNCENATPFISNDRYGGDKSDYYVFKNAGIPYIFLSVGWWECYHKPCDTLEKLNYKKMGGICLLIDKIIKFLLTKELERGSADTTKLEARSLSALIGKEVPPHRPTIDAIIGKIKSTYMGRAI